MPFVRDLLLLGLGALALLGCRDNLPGEVVGAYRVTMRATENSCGESGLPLADGHAYRVELRESAPVGYWRTPGAAPFEGRYDDGAFSFSFATLLELGDADAGTGGCLVRREELLTGRVEPVASVEDAGVRADSDAGPEKVATVLHGEHSIAFRPDPNGRCATVQGPVQVFERLPCSARYSLEGVEVESF